MAQTRGRPLRRLAGAGLAVMLEVVMSSGVADVFGLTGPIVIRVEDGQVRTSPEIARLVEELRSRADVFIFVAGGASKMSDDARERLLRLFGALEDLARRGVRFAVGDGGTKAGVMEAAGAARHASGGAFPLLGVSPASEITTSDEEGKTPVDPNHSHVVAIDSPRWIEARRRDGWTPDQGYWGSETRAMYEIFGRLAEGRPSVTLVANGGAIVLDEIAANISQGRSMIVVKGSGRAADAIVSLLENREPEDEEARALRARAEALGVGAHRDLFEIFLLDAGPAALADRLDALRHPR